MLLNANEFQELKNKPAMEIKPEQALTQSQETKVQYVLFHPDSIPGKYYNGFYKADDCREFEIIDGVIRVNNKIDCQTLVDQGFIFIKEVKNE